MVGSQRGAVAEAFLTLPTTVGLSSAWTHCKWWTGSCCWIFSHRPHTNMASPQCGSSGEQWGCSSGWSFSHIPHTGRVSPLCEFSSGQWGWSTCWSLSHTHCTWEVSLWILWCQTRTLTKAFPTSVTFRSLFQFRDWVVVRETTLRAVRAVFPTQEMCAGLLPVWSLQGFVLC